MCICVCVYVCMYICVCMCTELCFRETERMSLSSYFSRTLEKINCFSIYSRRKCPWNQNHIFKGNVYLNIISISFFRAIVFGTAHIYTSYLNILIIIKIQCPGMCAILSWNPQICIEIFKYVFMPIFLPIHFFFLLKNNDSPQMICARDFSDVFKIHIDVFVRFHNCCFHKYIFVRCFTYTLEYFGTLFLYTICICWFLHLWRIYCS